MAKLMRDRSKMGAVNLLAPKGARRLGEDLIERPDDPMAADVTAEGDVITHAPSAPLVLGMFTPGQVLLGAVAAWFLFGKK